MVGWLFLIFPLSISQFLDTPTKSMKLRLEILEILYNFIATSTPISATVAEGGSVQIRF